jgi:hypothetical protein
MAIENRPLDHHSDESPCGAAASPSTAGSAAGSGASFMVRGSARTTRSFSPGFASLCTHVVATA